MLNHKFHTASASFNQWAAVSLSLLSFDHPFDLEIQEKGDKPERQIARNRNREVSWGASDWTVPLLGVERPACPSAALMQFHLFPAYFLATQAWRNGEKPTLELANVQSCKMQKKGHESVNQASHLWLCHPPLRVLGWVTWTLSFYFIYRMRRPMLCTSRNVKTSWNKACDSILRTIEYYKKVH